MDLSNDFDRLLFFEHARKNAEAQYIKNPLDADNLTRWGGALLELSQFQPVADSKKWINDAISKLDEALTMDPKKPETLWCLGNAWTSNAFMTPDFDLARKDFDKANDYFARAVLEDPTNDLYVKSLEVAAKAPALHQDIHQKGSLSQMAMEQALGGGGLEGAGGPSASGLGGGPSGSRATKKKESSGYDWVYDCLGWGVVAGLVIVWVSNASRSQPPPPPAFG